MKTTKPQKRIRRHGRIRAKMKGTAERPRVAIYKSNQFTYAQVVDDDSGKTIIAVSDYLGKKRKTVKGTKIERATLNGKALAGKLKEKGISTVVFDRGGFKYHGRVKAFVEGLREWGIKL